MDYSRITDFLSKFSKILSESDDKKEIINSILIKYIKKSILKENFKLEKGNIVFSVSPLIKNEIYMNKSNILKDLNSLGIQVKDIR